MKRIANYSHCRTVPRDAKEGQVLAVANGQLTWVDTECGLDNYQGTVVYQGGKTYVVSCDGEPRKEIVLWAKPEPQNRKVRCNPTGRRYTQFRRTPVCLPSGGQDGDFLVYQCCAWGYDKRVCCVGYTDLESTYQVVPATHDWPEQVTVTVDLPECCANDPREKCITGIELAQCRSYVEISSSYEYVEPTSPWPAKVTLQVTLPECCADAVIGGCITSVDNEICYDLETVTGTYSMQDRKGDEPVNVIMVDVPQGCGVTQVSSIDKQQCASLYGVVAETEPTEAPPTATVIVIPDMCEPSEVVNITADTDIK